MFVVDTNILVHAANEDSDAHAPCLAALRRWRAQSSAWYLTWGICFEFLSVITNRRLISSPWQPARAWDFLRALQQSPALQLLVPSKRYAGVVEEILREVPGLRANDMHDMAIAALMRDHGIKTIYTRDMGFHRFRWLEVVDPVAAGHGGLHED